MTSNFLQLSYREVFSMGLIMVFDTILTARQSGQQLQCLDGNPMALNLF